MCSSPGGKTTQLAEYFPDSLIIANETDKKRLPQLYENLDRMDHPNICVTNYDGRYYQHFPEMFDAILLDAPCSGEGCAFKTPEALRNWHIKNIRRIAKLQYQLFLTAYHALKPGGLLMYSTCTLNEEENEGVVAKALKKIQSLKFKVQNDEEKHSEFGILNSEFLEPLGSRRLWPHETGTGGFFYAAFQKTSSPGSKTGGQDSSPGSEVVPPKNNILPAIQSQKDEINFDESQGHLYAFKKDRYVCSHDVSNLMEKLYFTKVGKTLKG